jgi:hypothetical protein
MMHKQLDVGDLFKKTRYRIMDMVVYIEGEKIKHQADTIVRLTLLII